MTRLLLTVFCLVSFLVQAQNSAQSNSVWEDGSQWDVYYTVDADDSTSVADEIRVTYRLSHVDNTYMALEKTVIINGVTQEAQLLGYIRNDNDSVIYVRPVLENGSIGDECLLYDFQIPYEYGGTVRYGVMNGEVKEEFIDWREDSLDYYMLNIGDGHCLPAWKGIIYNYGYIGGPMDLFLLEAAPGRTNRPKPTNISHVIFSTKGRHKITGVIGEEGESDVIIPYDEMLTQGTTWECLAGSNEQPDDVRTYNIHVTGDTLIGERSCQQIYSPEYNIQKTMFEEGRKVYVLNSDDNPEVLLDFGLMEGDCINDVEIVASIDMQENMGYNYRTITIDSGFDCQSFFAGDTTPWNYYLIEGIGINKDQFLRGQRFVREENTFSYLLRCWKDGTLVYQAPGAENITGLSEISIDTKPLIYDLQGHRLNKIPTKGIYIIGGKKRIGK